MSFTEQQLLNLIKYNLPTSLFNDEDVWFSVQGGREEGGRVDSSSKSLVVYPEARLNSDYWKQQS